MPQRRSGYDRRVKDDGRNGKYDNLIDKAGLNRRYWVVLNEGHAGTGDYDRREGFIRGTRVVYKTNPKGRTYINLEGTKVLDKAPFK